MDAHESIELFGVISNEVTRELANHELQLSCIHGTALLTKVLHQQGFPNARPLTVGVRIFNRAFQQWVEKYGPPIDEVSGKACDDAGGASIMLGKGTAGMVAEDRWPGHLVVVVPNAFDDRHALLDPTIVQAHKPEWDINLQPLCLRVRDDFVSGKVPYKGKVHGTLLVYNAYPDDHSYNEDGDWMSIQGLSEAASAVLNRLSDR